MNKKIKTLVQKYEKDMQFENRFDELKDKLDLIPDQNLYTDIIVIRKKLVPAYTMMIVLLMLVTGIIGLQFGLNSGYISGPEHIDIVDNQLSSYMDIYEREAVQSVAINDEHFLIIYVGYKAETKRILIRLLTKNPSVVLVGTVDGNEISSKLSQNFYVSDVTNNITTFDIDLVVDGDVLGSFNSTLDLSSYYEWLQE